MNAAIIVAAGKGARMGGAGDKLFLECAGKPVIAHTWERFDRAECIDEVILVVRPERQEAFLDLAKRFPPQKPFRFALGGPERQDSVWNGLEAISKAAELVAIQDGARPCTDLALIAATLRAAAETGAAVAAQRMTDTVKASNDGCQISEHLDRTRLWAVQTPQCFRIEVIRRALQAVREKNLQVTDDTAACELIGQAVRLVESQKPNPKVTVPEDLRYLQWLLASPFA